MGQPVNILAFDIETIPDTQAGRRAYGLDGLDDAGVAKAMLHLRRQETGRDFQRLHLHRIVAISVVLRHSESLRVWSLGQADSSEKELIERFFEGVDRYSPTLVSWNGGGFDLPVLHYRALLHGVVAPHYWEAGDTVREFRFNNYRNRFHDRHTDLMDVLAGFQARAFVPLDELASTLGLPGKMGMHGSEVWPQFLDGQVEGIRNYCETDALNTYLLYLRFELIRGELSSARFAEECSRVRDSITHLDRPHWHKFLARWVTQDQWCATASSEHGKKTSADTI